MRPLSQRWLADWVIQWVVLCNHRIMDFELSNIRYTKISNFWYIEISNRNIKFSIYRITFEIFRNAEFSISMETSNFRYIELLNFDFWYIEIYREFRIYDIPKYRIFESKYHRNIERILPSLPWHLKRYFVLILNQSFHVPVSSIDLCGISIL